MNSPKPRPALLLLPVVLVVFCAAFFLGRNTVSGTVRIETRHTPPEPGRTLTESAPPERILPLTESVPETEKQAVDLNRADVNELITLPGIGQTLAERIIAYREQYGGFSAVEQIMDVSGIGPATFEALEGLITVEDGT